MPIHCLDKEVECAVQQMRTKLDNLPLTVPPSVALIAVVILWNTSKRRHTITWDFFKPPAVVGQACRSAVAGPGRVNDRLFAGQIAYIWEEKG